MRLVGSNLLILAFSLTWLGCGETKEGSKPQQPGNKTSAEASSSNGVGESAAKPNHRGSARLETTLGGKPPASDDTLLMIYPDDPDTLNVLTSNDTVSTAFQRYVYEGLADQSFADPDKWEPALAESWTFDEKNLTYTIKLRKGVYWHPMSLPDGTALPRTEFTAADVKFTFDCILNEGIEAASLRSYFLNANAKDDTEKYKIKVTVVDDHTVKVKWTEPYFQAFEFTLGTAIMPRHVYGVDEHGDPISLDYRGSKDFANAFNNHWANSKMCGTGPLIFKEWAKNSHALLVRNPDYWGHPYYFSAVRYEQVKNPNTALQKTLNGDVDFAGIPQKDHYIQSKENEHVKSGEVKLVDFQYPGYRYLGFNLQRDLFKDKRVRWAISHAVPIDEIIDKVYFNLASRITGPFLPGSSANDESIPPVKYDLEAAKALLEEAGWKDADGDGIRENTVAGKKVDAVFELMIYADSPQYLQIAEIIKENCRRLGVQANIIPAQWALMLQRLRKKEFDATILGWALNWKNDPFQIFHGSQADLPESSNSGGYANPEVDALIERLRVTMDPEAQTEIYHKIHRLIYDDQPYVFLFADRQSAGYNARLENVHFYKIRPCYDSREWISAKPRVTP
jgi:ABC-type transport system substrate-binding protein